MSHGFKRPFVSNSSDPKGRGKWQKTTPASHPSPLEWPPGAIVFRVICPNSKCGSVIGKGGTIISRIRQETGTQVKLNDKVPGCDQRIVIIIGSEKDNTTNNEHKDGDNRANANKVDTKANKDFNEDNRERENTSNLETPKASEKELSLVQKALILVSERIIESEPVSNPDGNEDEARKSSSVTIELLIIQSQVGYLFGKGGNVIKKMKSDSGAIISLLPRDKIPACASLQDAVVQITGDINSARKALQLVSQVLIEHPPKVQAFIPRPTNPNLRHEARTFPSFHSPQKSHFPNRIYDNDVPHFPTSYEYVELGHNQGGTPEVIIFRMLCSNDKVGSVIGKGGSIIKTLQLETGSEIKILDTMPETEDRLIVISSPAIPVDALLPAQDGLLRVLHRIAMSVPGDNVLARLIVSSNQIGCVLGKGGSVISEMRKLSGANIHLLSKDQTPSCVSDYEELIQVTGELGAVQNALLQITNKLKDHCFRMIRGGHPPFAGQMPPPPFDSHFGRRDFSPPRMFPDYPLFQNEFRGHSYEERPPFPHGLHGPVHILERMPPAPWEQQAMRSGGSMPMPMPMPEYLGGPPPRRVGDFSGGNNPAIFTNTTVEVTVPRAIVPSIYGEEGSCLRRICEISEANITITESKPGAVETVIIIAGTLEQAHAAQSLIQAFVLSETAIS